MSVFYGDENDNLMTFDPDLMIGLDEDANETLHKLKHVADQHKKEVFLQEGDLLIIDNRRAVHGRNKFTAYYDGYDRWLQRAYVTRDIRQAEIIFSKKERVITYDFFNNNKQ